MTPSESVPGDAGRTTSAPSEAALAIVARCSKTSNHAMNVLTAALRTEPDTHAVPIAFARAGAVAAEIEASRARRVLCLWSFYSPEVERVVRELEDVRRVTSDRDVVHVAGGVHASAEPARTLRDGFDRVAVGDGERTLLALVRALLRGEASPASELPLLPGLGALDARGAYRSGGPAEVVALDDYPAFNVGDGRFNPIEITRGCLYSCKFCQTPFMFKAAFRHRSVDNVRRHVALMAERGLGYVRFVTPTALSYGSAGLEPNLEAVEALLRAVREALGREGRIYFGTFPSEVRPEHVTPRSMALLARYVDNDNLVIGGQSGSDRMLARTLRGHGAGDVLSAARVAVEHGFVPNVDMLFGMPGEEPRDQAATVELMRELVAIGARVHSHNFLPLPGTPLSSAAPTPIGAELAEEVGRLEASGRSYGQWRAQVVSAEQLKARRRALEAAGQRRRMS